MGATDHTESRPARLPAWLKRPFAKGDGFRRVEAVLAGTGLNTVCRSAACPNRGECFSNGTATFMIMGDVCTRDCRFCAVKAGQPAPLSPDEPDRLAAAVQKLGLHYVVITSVTRDDLPDGGAGHFARTITSVRAAVQDVTIEVLTPDFSGDTGRLDIVAAAQPDVFNHNLETPRRLTPQIRSGADYDRSMGVLRYMATTMRSGFVKSGFMVGLGESRDEIIELLADLRAACVQIVTIGQYLSPSKEHHPVQEFYQPEEFSRLQERAESMGFINVAAGPFVRSSYHAESTLQRITEPPAAHG